MREVRRLRGVAAALCLMLAVAGCEGPPAGAKETVQRLAALDVVTSAPPQGVPVAYDEELGLDGTASFNPPTVTVVYATSASVQEVNDFYISTFPAYGFAEGFGGGPSPHMQGKDFSTDGDVYFEIRASQGAPDYGPDGGPALSPAPAGADLYVIVEAYWFPHQDRSWQTRSP